MSESENQDPWASVPRQNAAAGPAQAPGYGGYPQPMPPGAYYGYPPIPVRRTNGLAVAALVCGLCGFVYLVPAILGIVFGVISVRQIRRDGTDGRGMAIAGIVTGAAWIALVVVLVLIVVGSNS